jgi:multidrug efflux pump
LNVSVGGGAGPSVRVEVNPTLLNSHGLTIQNIQSVLSQQNAHEPAGQISDGNTTADIVTNDQISHAYQFSPLIVGYNKGQAIRLSDVADVSDSTQNIRTAGYLNGTPSITIMIFRQPGANIIDTVDRVRAARHQDHGCS